MGDIERINELKDKIGKAQANKIAAENRIKELEEELKNLGIKDFSDLDKTLKELEAEILENEKQFEKQLEEAENELKRYSI